MTKFLTVLCCVVLSFGVAEAEYIEPGKVEIKTERYLPEQKNFTPGTYHYVVAWQGIPVANASVEVGDELVDEQPFYRVRATAKTGDFVKLFYRLRHTSDSTFEAESFRPIRFVSHQLERRRDKYREVNFADDGTIRFTSKSNGRQGSVKEFKSENFTLDPISAAFIARSLPIELGTKASFDVFNGKHRYLITCEVQGRDIITVNGRSYDAFRVVPDVQKLTDSDGEDRLKSATLWISADSDRHVLKLESKVWVGSVTATMESFIPAEPANAVRASLKQEPAP